MASLIQGIRKSLRFNKVAALGLIALGLAAVLMPATTGGASETTYTLTPALPEGVIFDAVSRTISGTPTQSADGAYTYTATNGADSITLRFNISVQPDN